MKAKKKATTAKKAAPAKAAAPAKKRPTTYAKDRYYAKEVNGKGYLFDKKFSANIPITSETSFAFAQRQAERFNAEEEAERAATVAKKCPAKKPAPKKPARTARRPMTAKKPAAKKSEYAKGKEAARNKAIKWLDDFDGRTMSWNELCDEQARLERLGKRYGLTKEFRENGII